MGVNTKRAVELQEFIKLMSKVKSKVVQTVIAGKWEGITSIRKEGTGSASRPHATFLLG